SGELNEVVHGVSFQVKSNEILGIVGESGSGKSVTALALMGLLPKKNCVITGKLTYRDLDLLKISNKQWQEIRSNKIAMVFQEPMSALNPSIHCGKQVIEVLLQHSILSVDEAKKEVLRLFEQVRLPDQEKIYTSYPHEISGGQMQRVVIAMAIACIPDVIIVYEPSNAIYCTVLTIII